ncbi:MAG: HAD family phosphatase [Marinilabiliaceae bacterium]|nr:HAD family phosphatase [Marinilabiliaceae bacterium]
MIKLIITDMDGTLLTSDNKLPDGFETVYQQVREAGIQFVVASGRQYYILKQEFEHIDHNILFVAENGGFIDYGKSTLLLNPFSKPDTRELIEAIRKIDGVYPVICGRDSAYIENDDPDFMKEVGVYFVKCQQVDDLTNLDDELLKIAVCDFRNPEFNSYSLLKSFNDRFQVSISSHIWLDIMPLEVNKGEAVRFLQQHLGITAEETMVFGDYLNDCQMMQAAYHSYAMANAHPDLKKVARFRTHSNDDHGVLKTIQEKLLILPE